MSFFWLQSFSLYQENNVFLVFIEIIVDITIAPLSIGWLAYFWRWTTLIGSFKLNINTRSNIFNSLKSLITIWSSACPKHNVTICMQLLNFQATYWKNLLNVSSLDIIWFSLATRELFSSLTLKRFIWGLFRTLLNI